MKAIDEVKQLLQKKHSHEQVIINALFQNELAWGMFYFPHHFRSKSPSFHLKIIREAGKNRYLAVQAPRESAKSTILNFLYISHCVAFQRKHFIVIVQNTFKKAVGSLETIKKEFKENQRLINDFKVEITKDAEGDSIFRHPNGFEIRVLCKGAEQIGSVRGEKFGAYRPDLILGDDMEDDEMVRSNDRRRQFQEDFDDALLPAGDAHICQYIFIGTILHDDCTMARLVNPRHYKEYRKLFYKARYEGNISKKMKSLWAEKWTLDRLNEMEQENPRKFAKEYQGDPTSGMMAKFDSGDFRKWTIQNNEYTLFDRHGNVQSKGRLSDCKPGISCDLAWEEKKSADFNVVMPGFLTPNSDLLIDKYVCKKGLRPNQIEEILFNLVERMEALTNKRCPIGFEKAKLEKVTKWFLKRAMRERNKPLIFKDIQWGSDKVERIVSKLEPRYHQNMIFHRDGMGDLEYQLMKFPYANHDDLCLEEGTKIATPLGDRDIEDMRVGDKVITPFGIRKVTRCGWTGMKETMDMFGLKTTWNHKIFNKQKSCFVSANDIRHPYELNRLSYKEVLKWKFLKLLSLKVLGITGWEGRKSIIFLNRLQISAGEILGGCMWRFMKTIGELKFRKAFMFIISMGIPLITTLKTLSVYQLLSIVGCLRISIKRYCVKALKRHKIKRKYGTLLKQVENGIENMLKECGNDYHITNLNVKSVYALSAQKLRGLSVAHKDVEIGKRPLKNVYNLTVEQDGVYYANGILVSNCDSLQGLVQILQTAPKKRKEHVVSDDPAFDYLRDLTLKKKKKVKGLPFVFGKKSKKLFEIPAKETFR